MKHCGSIVVALAAAITATDAYGGTLLAVFID
jgi:hypothetical protein